MKYLKALRNTLVGMLIIIFMVGGCLSSTLIPPYIGSKLAIGILIIIVVSIAAMLGALIMANKGEK